jgi:hypothetical protein
MYTSFFEEVDELYFCLMFRVLTNREGVSPSPRCGSGAFWSIDLETHQLVRSGKQF